MKKCITWQESGQLISIATSWVLIHCTIKAFQNHPPGCLIYNHNIQIRQALLSSWCISTTICVTSWLYASGSCVNSIWFKWCTSSVIIFTFDKALPDPKRLFSAEVLGMRQELGLVRSGASQSASWVPAPGAAKLGLCLGEYWQSWEFGVKKRPFFRDTCKLPWHNVT